MTAKLEEDEDIAQEREAVEAGDGRQGDKVTIQRLRKTYPGQGKNPPKVHCGVGPSVAGQLASGPGSASHAWQLNSR